LGLNAGTQQKIMDFVTMIRSFSVQLDTQPAYELAHLIASSSGLLKDLYNDKTPEGVSKYENVQELLNGIKEFTDIIYPNDPHKIMTLSEFLIDVALLTDADNEDESEKEKVSLMTIHASKGLEFPYVFIVGLEENLFPSMMAMNSREELEEERRLFYVALTRAEKKVTLSYATTRYKWGQMTFGEPSRFIDELDDKFIDKSNHTKPYAYQSNGARIDFGKERGQFGSKPKTEEAPIRFNPSPPPLKKPTIGENFKKVEPTDAAENAAPMLSLETGQTVMHEKFGKGKVIKMEGQGPDVKATIFFPKEGQKQLLLKFAKLTIID
jgi:DNA helicase-2/ATP-dependent DNA helicase PcrA